jgi:hypothetical protein
MSTDEWTKLTPARLVFPPVEHGELPGLDGIERDRTAARAQGYVRVTRSSVPAKCRRTGHPGHSKHEDKRLRPSPVSSAIRCGSSFRDEHKNGTGSGVGVAVCTYQLLPSTFQP